MKYQIKSAEVLNEADRFQRMLDWELFTSAQDVQLNHSHIEGVSWRPGDFLYDFPGLDVCDDLECEECARRLALGSGSLPNPNYEGNCVRPMFELFEGNDRLIDGMRWWPAEDDNFYIDSGLSYSEPICCGVWWDRYTESDCWVCGKGYPLLEQKKLKFGKTYRQMQEEGYFTINQIRADLGLAEIVDVQENPQGMIVALQFNEDAWRRATQRAADQMRQFARGFEGFSVGWMALDEYVAFDLEMAQMMNLASIDPGFVPEPYFYEPRGMSIHNPFIDPVNIFQRPNTRGPIWGTAALYDPLFAGEYSANRFRLLADGELPRNWRQMRAEIPLPQLPEPRDYSDWTPGERNGPPTTPNWRNR